MDPVTHAVMARMAASVGTARISRATALLAVAGGLAPDADAVFMPAGWDIYLRVHEVGTHSLAGAFVLAAVLAGVWRACTAGSFRTFFLIALAAVASHLLLDVVSGASIRPAWPFAGWRTNLGLVAMADPWLAVPVASALVVVVVTRLRIETVAPYVFAFTVLLLAGKAVSRHTALAQYRRATDPAGFVHSAQAQWGSLTGWWIYERTPDRVRAWTVDARTGIAATALEMPTAPIRFLLRGEDQLAPVRNALVLHDLPVRVTTARDNRTTVFWSDLRFCFAPDMTDGPRPGSHLRPSADPIACGVWFGGELDAHGRVVRQFVTIGEYLQPR
jgi:membrane-bound metal-dependent hydrolase YbcI (DUF457 family)